MVQGALFLHAFVPVNTVAYGFGRGAFERGRTLRENPYTDKGDYLDWRSGWFAAEFDANVLKLQNTKPAPPRPRTGGYRGR